MRHPVDRGLFRQNRPKKPIPVIERVIVPPAPVSRYCAKPENDGVGPVMRYQFPVAGIVSDMWIDIESLHDEQTAIVQLEPLADTGSIERIEIAAGSQQIPGAFSVAAGEKLLVAVVNPQVEWVWVSFMFQASKASKVRDATDDDRGGGPRPGTA